MLPHRASRVPRRLGAVTLTLVGVALSTFAVAADRDALQVVAGTDLALARAAAERAPGTGVLPPAAPRYTLVGDCLALRTPSGAWVGRDGDAFVPVAARAAAVPLRFQAVDLGRYLLMTPEGSFLGTPTQVLPGAEVVTGPATDRVQGTSDETLDPVREPVVAGLGTATGVGNGALAPAREAARGTGVVALAEPGATAEWVVRDASGGFVLQQPVDDLSPADPGPLDPPVFGTLVQDGGGLGLAPGATTVREAVFGTAAATGCGLYPEADLDLTGDPHTGPTPYGETRGYVDAHLHLMAFEFLGGRTRCGRPWHPYGIAYALVDCPDHEPGGHGALLEDVVSGNTPGTGHATDGYPSFSYWPKYSSLTHEQVYYRWLERAHRGGLRMITALLVENGQLCELWVYKKNPCNEMDSVRLQAQRLHELVRYVDAQAGGPGRGWLQVVTDPFQARRVINAGQLAVVMGIEVSVPLDCGEYLGVPRCTAEDIDTRLQEVYDLGVRQMEATNKFDNALTGVTGDGGTTSLVVNTGNKGETGHYWQMGPCDQEADGHTVHQHDKTHLNVGDDAPGADQVPGPARDSLFGGVLTVAGTTGAAPVYGPGPHCNVLGLSALGREFVSGLARRGMIFDPDHMSARARQEAVDLVEKAGYSGVLSSHSWSDDANYAQILRIGGVVTPHAGSSTGIVEKWRALRRLADDRYTFGLGFGSDINGFSTQGGPPARGEDKDLDYPFTAALGGAVVRTSTTGQQAWDYDAEGIDHYGLYVDWAEDARRAAGKDGAAFQRDLERAAEAYLQMWERAVGVRPDACRRDVADLSASRVASVSRGQTPEQVLLALGQPRTRVGTAFGYCTARGELTVRFDGGGRVASLSGPGAARA